MLADLRLTDFRNYRQAEFSPAPGLNLIVGANGSGKTSLLEAIYFIGSGGRSFRGGRLSRLVRDGADAAPLFARVRLVRTLTGSAFAAPPAAFSR